MNHRFLLYSQYLTSGYAAKNSIVRKAREGLTRQHIPTRGILWGEGINIPTCETFWMRVKAWRQQLPSALRSGVALVRNTVLALLVCFPHPETQCNRPATQKAGRLQPRSNIYYACPSTPCSAGVLLVRDGLPSAVQATCWWSLESQLAWPHCTLQHRDPGQRCRSCPCFLCCLRAADAG